MTLLAVSYVIHVLSAALWTSATIYAAFPPARAGDLSPAAVDGLLQITRWTGLTLPATGLYQTWRSYPLDTPAPTPRGWLAVAMSGLWGATNGLLELCVYRMRTLDGTEMSVGRYVREGFVTDGGTSVARQAAVGWLYLLVAVGFAVFLLVNAGLLAIN